MTIDLNELMSLADLLDVEMPIIPDNAGDSVRSAVEEIERLRGEISDGCCIQPSVGKATRIAAFPGPFQETRSEDIHEGMMLRDYFAAAALQGCLAYSKDDINGNYQNNCSPDGAAKDAYEYADAMMRARGE